MSTWLHAFRWTTVLFKALAIVGCAFACVMAFAPSAWAESVDGLSDPGSSIFSDLGLSDFGSSIEAVVSDAEIPGETVVDDGGNVTSAPD